MSIQELLDMLSAIFYTTGISHLTWQYGIMWAIAGLFLYLAMGISTGIISRSIKAVEAGRGGKV